MFKKIFLFLLGFNLFFLQSYLLRFSLWGYSTYLQEILLVGTFLSFLLWKGPKSVFLGIFKHPLLLIFAGLAGLSVLLVPVLDVSELLRGSKFLLYALLFVYLFTEAYPTEKQRLLGFSLLAYGALSFGLFSVLYNLLGYNVQHDLRLSGPLDSAVYLAFYLAPAVLIFAHALLKDPRSWSLWLAFVLTGLLLLATRSFGSIGAVALVLTLFSLLHTKLPFLRTRAFKVILILGGLLFLIATFYVKILPTLQTSYSSLDERGEIWLTSVHLLREPQSFVFGVGFAQFQAHYEQAVVDVLGHEPLDYKVLQPHNIFLWFWMNFGIFGLVFFLWVLIHLMILLWKKAPFSVENLALYALLIFVIHGFIDTPFLKNDLLFMVLLFMEVGVGPLLLRQLEIVFHKVRQFCRG